jgi:hypothetical protein
MFASIKRKRNNAKGISVCSKAYPGIEGQISLWRKL